MKDGQFNPAWSRAEAKTHGSPAASAHDIGATSGAPPSNTAPAKDTGSIPKILRTGVDSLYCSWPGSVFPEIEQHLETLKQFAQFAPPDRQQAPQMTLRDHLFDVAPSGRGRFPYLLRDNWYEIQLSRASAKSLPFALVKFSSELLSNSGVMKPYRKIQVLLDDLGESEPCKVSRLDICADFHTEFDFSSPPVEAWISQSKRMDSHWVDEFTGFSFGLGGSISARLYDKTREIQKSGKTFLYPLWSEGGWLGELPVWRLEFQFRREVLAEFGVQSVEDVEAKLDALWAYGTEKWLRLTVPSQTDSARTRWPTHPIWTALQKAEFNAPGSAPLDRTRKQRLPSADYLYVNGLGGLTSFMAAHSITNVEEGMRAYLVACTAHHKSRAASSFSFARYLQRKLREKARRYNTKLKADPKDRDPGAYKKAKGGE